MSEGTPRPDAAAQRLTEGSIERQPPTTKPVDQRTFANGVSVSQLILGTMRLPTSSSIRELSDLLCALHDLGIDTHHSSSEYETYPRYLQALKRAGATGRHFKHVVKLAEPSWDDVDFSNERFLTSVETGCEELGTGCIDVVQWMVRTKDPTNDEVRLPLLGRNQDCIAAAFTEAKTSKVVGSIACFGYTNRFLDDAARFGLIDGITGYYNSDESNNEMFSHGLPILGIRPFGGGRLLHEGTPASQLLQIALKPAAIRATIVGISSIANGAALSAAIAPA